MANKAVVFLANGFEEVEALTCVDYLRRAGANLLVCGVSGMQATGSHGISVNCDCRSEDLQGEFDIVVLPGGMPGAANLAANQGVEKTVREAFENKKIVAAICAAPVVVLGKFGLLKGKKFTCYAGMEKNFAQFCGADWQKKNEGMSHLPLRVVQDENLISACGPGATEEFALKIVEAAFGADKAAQLKDEIRARSSDDNM